jgi:hypothetical protein
MLKDENLSYLDFDIYSQRISFFYKNKEKIGSTFGFILSVFYAIVSIILFLVYFIKTINRQEITASDTTIYPSTFPSIVINKDSFYLAFGLVHPTKLIRFIDERIYYPEVLFIEKIRQNGQIIETNQKILNLEKCESINFGNNYQHLFEKDELNNSYCLKDFNLTLVSGIKNDKISFIQINIFPCINNTQNNNHCKPQKEIDEYLTSGYFSILAKDIGLNPFNNTFPIVPTIQDLLTSINKSVKKELIIYYGITEIESDIGLFIDNIKKEIYLKYIKDDNHFIFFDNEQYYSRKEIIRTEIKLEDNIYLHKRKYTKMSQVFSTIGGYMQIISTILSLIVLLTKKISIEKKLLNNLFNFNFKDRKIILSIEYEKKLDYCTSMDKERKTKYIPYEAKKSIIMKRQYRRNSILLVRKKNQRKSPPVIKKSFTEINFLGPKDKENNQNQNNGKKNVVEVFNKLNKKNYNEGENENEQNEMIDQSINRSKVNMINKEDNHINLNNVQINKIFEKKKILWNKSNLGALKDLAKREKVHSPFISFNIFDYYCLRKVTRRKTDIELFNFAINFYKRQMDIINFFNIIILTQIMIIKQSGHKKLSHTIELSVK